MRKPAAVVGLMAAVFTSAAVAQRDPLATRGGWEIGLQAAAYEYDAFANGRQRTYLSDVGPGLGDATNRQVRGRGLRGQLAFEGRRWAFSLWPHYWKIKNSDVQPVAPGLGIYEAANTTHETGVEVRYRF